MTSGLADIRRVGAIPWLLPLAAILLLFAALPFLLTQWGHRLDPFTMDLDAVFRPPSLEFPFGTDAFGRCMVARFLLGLGLTLQALAVAVVTTFVLGVVLGVTAGWFHGRWPDRVFNWVAGLVYTVPFYLIAVAAAAILRPGLVGAFFILGLLAWAVSARLVRAEIIQLRSAPFVLALRSAGFSEAFILFRVLLPMAVAPALVSVVFFVPELVGVEVGLSFFGLGARPPTPSLGRELYAGLAHAASAPWLVWFPAIGILLLVLTFFTLGFWLKRSLPFAR